MPRRYSGRLKQKMRDLRAQGWSLGEMSKKSKIPKNTLSGWVKDIRLTSKQKERIREKIVKAGAVGRPLAALAIRAKIEDWKEGIRGKVKHFKKMPFQNPEISKAMCGILYACEGAKYPASRFLYFGNTDPGLISFFLTLLRRTYDINEKKLRFDVMHRWDQDDEKLKHYWSKITKIPISQCFKSRPDIRTKGKPTLKRDYRGICRIIYYDTSLQFELQSIGETIIKSGAEGI